jgi:hypothetical protein
LVSATTILTGWRKEPPLFSAGQFNKFRDIPSGYAVEIWKHDSVSYPEAAELRQ